MQYIEYICLGLCALHFFIELFTSFLTGRKINKLCDKCHLPIYDELNHKCALTEIQLSALVEFVDSLKKGDE